MNFEVQCSYSLFSVYYAHENLISLHSNSTRKHSPKQNITNANFFDSFTQHAAISILMFTNKISNEITSSTYKQGVNWFYQYDSKSRFDSLRMKRE